MKTLGDAAATVVAGLSPNSARAMRRVILESPYSGDVARNVAYARAALRDCALRGESALASHLLWTQEGVLDDLVAEERALGIELGLAWLPYAEATVAYTDLGVSDGMRYGIERARREGRPVEYRTLEAWHAPAPAGVSQESFIAGHGDED